MNSKPTKKYIKCKNCNGKGCWNIPSIGSLTCPVCHGAGTILKIKKINNKNNQRFCGCACHYSTVVGTFLPQNKHCEFCKPVKREKKDSERAINILTKMAFKRGYQKGYRAGINKFARDFKKALKMRHERTGLENKLDTPEKQKAYFDRLEKIGY